MAQYDQIQAKNYNDVRRKVNAVLGNGSPIYGYGQTLTSTEVSAGMKIEKTHFDALRNDIDRCIRHQQGENTTFLDIPEIIVDRVINWDDFVGFSYMADVAYDGKDGVYEGSTGGGKTQQTDIVSGGLRTLSAGWGSNASGQRFAQQTYTVKWDNSNAARYFFNSGGFLRLICEPSGTATNSKSVGWNSVIHQLNDYYFTFDLEKYREAISGNQTSFTIQIYDSTNPYTENFALATYTLINAKTIKVLVQLHDNDAGDHNPSLDVGLGPFGTAIDETVTIDIKSGLEYRTSTDAVTVNNPQFTVANFTLPENSTYQEFASAGDHIFPVPPGVTVVQVLTVGGGGGGAYPEAGFDGGGGGGGGEARYTSITVVPYEQLRIHVGKGGAGGQYSSGVIFSPEDGADSDVTSISGASLLGRGGKAAKGNWGGNSGNGHSGGVPARLQLYGAGGGGNTTAGNRTYGGNGTTFSLASINTTVGAGGGGGNSEAGSPAQYGGYGGAGDGATSVNSYIAGDGTDGTGGGGGGAAATGSGNNVVNAGRGGCGLVVIFC